MIETVEIGIIEAIVRAAATLMDRTGGFDVQEKGARENIVTSSDLAVQHFLTRELKRQRELLYQRSPR